MHTEASELAGKTVRIRKDVEHFRYPDFGGSEFRVEDWWDRLTGGSWMNADGNPAAMVYGMRAGLARLPTDDDVLYGKIGAFGSLVHISEIEEMEEEEDAGSI